MKIENPSSKNANPSYTLKLYTEWNNMWKIKWGLEDDPNGNQYVFTKWTTRVHSKNDLRWICDELITITKKSNRSKYEKKIIVIKKYLYINNLCIQTKKKRKEGRKKTHACIDKK